ncbi:MAG: hypothetical protein JO276_15905 [Sphingomonadaceae bacterium]|nr:hypothetical protein [Sphingomonadaceae bacterium]
MRASILLALAAGTLASAATAGQRLGPLPPGAIAHSIAGPSDQMIGYLAFDPAPLAALLPPGVRFRTLGEKAADYPGLARYVARHPERRGWAWSFFEIIGISAARYDRVAAHFRGGRGGMAVWYPELARTDGADRRPLGDQNLAAGSWVSDPRLARHMRRRGFPATAARIDFRIAGDRLTASLSAPGLTISGSCTLAGPFFVPEWAQEPVSYETMWTQAGEGDTYEIVTWAGHRARRCEHPAWRVAGVHPFARAFNDPALGDPNMLPAAFAGGYMLESALYRRAPARR